MPVFGRYLAWTIVLRSGRSAVRDMKRGVKRGVEQPKECRQQGGQRGPSPLGR